MTCHFKMKYVQYKYVKKKVTKVLQTHEKKLSMLFLLKLSQQYSCLQLCVRPCEHNNNEGTRRSSLGSSFTEYGFLCFQQGQHERHLHLLEMTGEFSGMPVFIEPNLSGGYRIDDNQTVAKQIKVIKPITGNQTPLTSLLIWINSRGLLLG